MGHLDAFIQRQISHGLLPGEAVLGTGCLQRPTRFNVLGIPSAYETYLVAATDRRLLLIATESGLFGDVLSPPKALNRGVTVLGYDAIRQVTTGPVGGIGGGRALVLALHPGATQWGAEARFDSFPRLSGLDGQEQLHASFAGWLHAQLARGAFPMSAETQQRVAAHAAAAAQAEVRAAEQRARRKASAIGLWPWLIRLGLPAIPALVTLVLGVSALDALASSARQRRTYIDPSAAPYADAERDRGIRVGSLASLACFATVGASGLGLFVTRSRRA